MHASTLLVSCVVPDMSIHPASALLFETRSRPYGTVNNINNNNKDNLHHLNSTRDQVEQLTITRTVTSNSTDDIQHKTTSTTTESSRFKEEKEVAAERHRKRKTIVVDATPNDQVDQQSGASSARTNGVGGGGSASRFISISANGRGHDIPSSLPSPSSNSTTTTSKQNLTTNLVTANNNNNSSAYSDLLRYRSQEFYHRLQPFNGGANLNGEINCAVGQLRSRELSLIDLSQVGLQNSYHRHHQQNQQPQHYYHNQPNQYYPVITNSLLGNATLGRRVTGETAKKNLNFHNNNLAHYSSQQFLQQPQKTGDYQHHPHYTNHLFQRHPPGTGNNSINRSNSSLSLNHNLLQKLEAKRSAYLNSRTGNIDHHRSYHLSSNNNVSELGNKQSQVSSAASTVSCSDHSNDLNNLTISTTSNNNNMSNIVSGAASATPTKNTTAAAYYNKMNGQQQQTTPTKMTPSTTAASMMMLGNNSAITSNNTRAMLTRSSSSDPRNEPPATLSAASGGRQFYQLGPQQPVYHNYHFLMPNGTTHTISGAGAVGSSSPSSSSSSYGYGHSGSNVYNTPSRPLQTTLQHQGASMSLMTQSAYGSIGYNAGASNNNVSGNRLASSKESSPTKLSVLGKQTSLGDNSSTTSAASARFPVYKQQQIASGQYNQHQAQHQQKAKTIDSRSMVNYPTNSSLAANVTKNNNNNSGSNTHFSKNLFGASDGSSSGGGSNLFEAKKNKLFGSVSSIVDIQVSGFDLFVIWEKIVLSFDIFSICLSLCYSDSIILFLLFYLKC